MGCSQRPSKRGGELPLGNDSIIVNRLQTYHLDIEMVALMIYHFVTQQISSTNIIRREEGVVGSYFLHKHVSLLIPTPLVLNEIDKGQNRCVHDATLGF